MRKLVSFRSAIAVVTVVLVGASYAMAAPPPATAPSGSAAASVLLFADMSEADASCGCGQIIHWVRKARDRGVPTTEVDTGKDSSSDLARRHRVLVSPSVLLLDASGREVRRFEGETSEVIRSIKAELDKIPAKKA